MRSSAAASHSPRPPPAERGAGDGRRGEEGKRRRRRRNESQPTLGSALCMCSAEEELLHVLRAQPRVRSAGRGEQGACSAGGAERRGGEGRPPAPQSGRCPPHPADGAGARAARASPGPGCQGGRWPAPGSAPREAARGSREQGAVTREQAAGSRAARGCPSARPHLQAAPGPASCPRPPSLPPAPWAAMGSLTHPEMRGEVRTCLPLP